ncbi:branched-chain amino acid ABC transporter permease [Glaciimonas immobilis]|uniref:Branched-chain amino acid transport system permease protein n=1 Tax=Glaciimonas immobilis TaxID=728004 RepID=A0A840RQ52_9BURK|nr:branched-chain amino acid ABC transporter permease [Glaciimonas immobilis]KAF3998178.1 branched-chain amino acid ABC transporter permease [Glaciimonas immobilis]MBB5199108.1 branched-chain amino acid transport system permease protein [Glaciimonas immobilis]
MNTHIIKEYLAKHSPSGTSQPIQLIAVILIVTLLALMPVVATLTEQSFYLTIVTRIMIFSLAALGLNLILGFGAMVSLGHAMYVGIGAYSVGILSFHGIGSGWAHLGIALCVGTLSALLVGAISLRVTGVAFIMITLAFAQMFYFLVVGLREYGGDDGLPISSQSNFGIFSLTNPTTLYYTVFAILMVTLYGFHRLVNARFGMLIRGCKSNQRRMLALGFPVFRYKLTAYVLSAQVCVVAGVLLANLTRFTSPSYMSWSASGELIVMVVLGGIGTLIGPVVGAATWLILEELLTSFRTALPWGIDAMIRDYWLAVFGILIIVVTLTLKHGLYGTLLRRREHKQ